MRVVAVRPDGGFARMRQASALLLGLCLSAACHAAVPAAAPAFEPPAAPVRAPKAAPLSQSRGLDQAARAAADRQGNRARIHALWTGLERLQREQRGDELLRSVDEMVTLVELDAQLQALNREVVKLRDEVRLQAGAIYAAQGRHEDALAVFKLAPA